MERFWAVINLHEDETAQELLMAMFSKEEFNSQNAILIQEKMAILEVFFEETPPKKIAEAIGGYCDVRCGFGEVSEECLKKGGLSPEQVYPKKDEGGISKVEPADATEEPPHDEGESEGGGIDKPPIEPIGVAEEQPLHDEEETTSGEEDVPLTNTPKAVKGRNKPRKAPDNIPAIDKIATRCVSYSQFASAIARWLELGKRESYFIDLAETAAGVEKISWGPIEKELAKKGYCNPFANRQRTSIEVTKKLAEMEIECSFIALVEYVAKYKSFDFRSAIESRVSEVLCAMGLLKEAPEIQRQISKIAIEAVMAESNDVCIDDICKAVLGPEAHDDDICDAKMNFSNFANQYLEKIDKQMMSAQEFINQFRKEIFMW